MYELVSYLRTSQGAVCAAGTPWRSHGQPLSRPPHTRPLLFSRHKIQTRSSFIFFIDATVDSCFETKCGVARTSCFSRHVKIKITVKCLFWHLVKVRRIHALRHLADSKQSAAAEQAALKIVPVIRSLIFSRTSTRYPETPQVFEVLLSLLLTKPGSRKR